MSQCKQKSAQETNAQVNTVSDVNASMLGEKFIRDVEVLGTRIKTQFDMGASVCTIKAATALDLGLQMERKVLILEGFGENVVKSLGIVSADVCVDNLKPKKINFRVVSENVERYDVILGRPFTESLDITYTRMGCDLTFSEIDPSLFVTYDNGKARTYALENVQIKPNSVHFINVKT